MTPAQPNPSHPFIPTLPDRPRFHPLDDHVCRSYPLGRLGFSRVCKGEALTLTLTADRVIPSGARACLVTNLQSPDGREWSRVHFLQTDDRTLTCRITPEYPGLRSLRAEFSLNHGATWLPDTVPDAWVLVDPPVVDALRLYTMIPTVSGTFADWAADLARISAMGFNAIHLLPITSLDRSESPYAPSDLFAIDHSYLITPSPVEGLDQLADYVAEARRLNLRLCFDLVLNHVGVTSDMVRKAPDWIVPDQNRPDGMRRAGYLSDNGWRTWEDLVLINFEHPSESIRSEIWAYMTAYALFWARYANDTGGLVRFDNLHGSDPEFVQSLTTVLHATYPSVGILAEFFTDDGTLLRTAQQWGLNLHLATSWVSKFVPDLRDYLRYIHRMAEHLRYLTPITSHDSGSPAEEFGTADSTVPRYVVAALLGTGATGMPQGVEYAERERIDFIQRKPRAPLPSYARFAEFIGLVNGLLARHSAFHHGGNCLFVDDNHPAIIAAFRRDPTSCSLGFLVVCNFDTHDWQSISIKLAPILQSDGPLLCVELLSGESETFHPPYINLRLPPCGVKVFQLTS